jgi:hypothetical protein
MKFTERIRFLHFPPDSNIEMSVSANTQLGRKFGVGNKYTNIPGPSRRKIGSEQSYSLQGHVAGEFLIDVDLNRHMSIAVYLVNF